MFVLMQEEADGAVRYQGEAALSDQLTLPDLLTAAPVSPASALQTILDLRRMDRPCKDSKDTKLTVKLKTGLNYLLKVCPMRCCPRPCIQATNKAAMLTCWEHG